MSKSVKIAIIIITILVLVILSVFIFSLLKNKDLNEQKELVNQYFSCINEQKYDDMYEMISEESKQNISKEDFIRRNKNIYEGIDTSNLKIDIFDLTEKDKINTVSYNEKFFTAAGEVSFSNSMNLIKENRKYKIVWNSKLIFPELEEDYKVKITTLKAIRGAIYDRNERVIAYDGKISEVGIVPGKLGEDKDVNIEKISELLGITVEKINTLLSASYVKEDTFVPLKKISKNNEELKEKLLDISGIMISNADGRVYELGEEAAHLIGYVQTINAEELKKHEGQNYTTTSVIGKTGLEYYYEQKLRGIDGTNIYIENEKGEKVKDVLIQNKKDGESIKLTIDYDLQKEFFDQMKNDKGLFVVMKPETGELLALVSTPTYNSNDFILGMSTEKWNNLNNDEEKPLYNRFRQSYCPGSTFKPITAAIGLTEGIINDDTEFNYSGTSWQKNSGWGNYYVTTLTAYNERKNVTNAIIRSDNIFFAQCALAIGETKFTDGLKKLGFEETIEFPISLKSSQYLNKDSKFTETKLANSGYGQGDILVNPVHMASIYSSFVNNGNMVKPYVEFCDGKKEYLKENVFSEDAASIVKNAMMNVIYSSGGTANDAKVMGMTMIGKTGTAELKKSKDDTESGTLGWFNCITLNRRDGNLLIVGMVENKQNNSSGGSHNVIAKIKKVLDK